MWRRAYQAATDTISQASDAPMKAAGTLLSTISEKIAKASMPSAPERRAGGVERGRLSAASYAVEASFPLAADFMLLDQLGTRAEDGGKSEKETADGCSIAAADEPGEYGRPSA
jgi:hypothetical protein